MQECVIVGGGPVGLWTAIQLKKRDSNINIYVYERYDEYQRSHVIRLDNWSMILFNKMKNNKHEKEFIKNVTGSSLTKMMVGFTDTLFIRTNDLEKALKEYCFNLNVNIVKKRIKSPEEVEEMHPECMHFIAADGAKSLMRTKLFGSDAVDFKEMQRIIELKFNAENETFKSKENLSNLLSLVKLNYGSDYLSFEYVGEYKNNLTPITTRMFLNEECFNKIPEATFKEPLTFDVIKNKENNVELVKNIENYLNFRMMNHKDKININEINITKLILSIYAAKRFAIFKEENNKAWFLTGDAAMGVPYFRSLNCGMMLSSRLSQILTRKTAKIIGNELKNQVLFFNTHRVLHMKTEFAIAETKNAILNTYNKLR